MSKLKLLILSIAFISISGCTEAASDKEGKYKYTVFIPDVWSKYTDNYEVKDGVITFTDSDGYLIKSVVWTVKENNNTIKGINC